MTLSLPVSVSPTTSSNLHSRYHQHPIHQSSTPQSNNVRQPRVLHPFAIGELRLLLVENISKEAVKTFEQHGFQVDHHTKAWSEEELLQKIGQYHAIGIRSKTRITEKVLKAATRVSLPQFSPRFLA
jgi:D-3-phosphoglycerate dehydrogenase / 2-oxoglutarate reductase